MPSTPEKSPKSKSIPWTKQRKSLPFKFSKGHHRKNQKHGFLPSRTNANSKPAPFANTAKSAAPVSATSNQLQINRIINYRSGIITRGGTSIVANTHAKGPATRHAGENGVTKGGGVTGLHLLFGDKNAGVGHVHIDYRGLFEGHYQNYNSDVRAVGPERRGGQPINNYERYKSWFGPIPGYAP